MVMTQLTKPSQRQQASLSRKQVLLVDDDPCLRSTTACLLVQEGYDVEQAYDGCQALRLALNSPVGTGRYDLIVTDAVMSDVSGMDFLTAIRAMGILTPILVITGVLDSGVLERLQRMAPLEFILKPFKKEEFIKYVDALLAAPLWKSRRQGGLPCRK